jgi:hypothetical protein
LTVRSIITRPVAIAAVAALALVVVLGGVAPSFFVSTPANAATSRVGATSVEAALGVAPSAVTLAAVSNQTAVGLATAAAVSAKSASAPSASSLPLVKPKVVPKPAAKAPKAAAKPAAKARAPRRKAPPRKAPKRKPVRRAVKRASYPVRPSSAGGAEKWRPVVRYYLKRSGVWSQFIEDKTIHIINGESSGNPNCVTNDYVGLLQFNSEWMSRAERLNPYASIARFVRVYKEGGLSAIKRNWSPTYN